MQPFLDSLKSPGTAQAAALLDQLPDLLHGQNAQGASWLATAIYHGRADIAQLFLDRGRTPNLHEAAMLGLTDQVLQHLADHPESIDSLSPDGFPPLSLAVFFGHAATFQAILDKGASVHTPSANSMQVRPLHAAAARRDLASVQTLLAQGADPNARQSQGFTALHTAAANNDQPLADALLQAGAHPSPRSDSGQTPAEIAREKGHETLAALLAAY